MTAKRVLKSKLDHATKRVRTSPLLVLGALLLFGSWCTQNFLSSQWESELNRMLSSQSVFDSQRIELLLRHESYVRAKSDAAANGDYHFELYSLAKSYGISAKLSANRAPKIRGNIKKIEAVERYEQNIEEFYKGGNTEGMEN